MKKKVAIIFGGRSVEHEVSVITGLQVMENMDREKYDLIPIYIDKEGRWLTGNSLFDFENFKNKNLRDLEEVMFSLNTNDYKLYRHPNNFGIFTKKFINRIDLVFPTLHGTNGEDGSIQGLLELINIPYAGSGLLASSVGMDKILMKEVFKAKNLPIVKHKWFYRGQWLDNREKTIKYIEEGLKYPMFVKPANLGSSIGISKAKDREALINAIEIGIRYDRKIIVEEAVENPREINCAVMGYDRNVISSLCEEPLGWEEILTFEDKYIKSNIKGAGKEGIRKVIPANIDKETREKVEKLAKESFISIDGRGNSRVDFLIDEKGEIFVNEINTLPGSLAFYLWEDKGYPFKELISHMIEIGFKAHEEKKENIYMYEAELLKRINFAASKNGTIKGV